MKDLDPWVKVHITAATRAQMVPTLTDVSRISVVVHVSDHFVGGKLQLTE